MSIASGSTGNCHYIGSDQSGILIDCGISTRQIFTRLDSVGISDPKIDAVFITHGHSDHIGAANRLSKKLEKRSGGKIPFYMSKGTMAFSDPRVLPNTIERIAADEQIQIKDIVVDAFGVPHDAPETLGFRAKVDDLWVGVITDLGHITSDVLDKMRTLTIMALEFNHDLEMLYNGSYPASLKARVSSDFGHLSNRQAAAALRQAISPTLRHLVLSHLSENNNTPSRAFHLAQSILFDWGSDEIECIVADPKTPSRPIVMGAPSLLGRGGQQTVSA